jgi:hypothetical protein
MGKFNQYLIIALLGVVLFLLWRSGHKENQSQKEIVNLRKSIIANDKLVKEADGRYAKLVNYYNTESDLKNQLKKSNEELYSIIRKQGDKILSLTDAVITLEGAVSEGTAEPDTEDTNKINLKLKYPEDNNPFITWDGFINKKTAYYKGEWKFGKLPIQIVLTETNEGLWKTQVLGPEWFKLDSLQINALPPPVPSELKKIEFMFGGGYYKSINPNGISFINLGGGISLFRKHNIFINITTNQQFGINYFYKF